MDFYPRSPCGERLTMPDLCQRYVGISIHALLAESDKRTFVKLSLISISIHALLAESDTSRLHKNICGWGFLSTLSLRRATAHRINCSAPDLHFYPRSPCGERHCDTVGGLNALPISIHALLAESDRLHSAATRKSLDFYPRSPCGERRCNCNLVPGRPSNFYPRSPCGERPRAIISNSNSVLDFYPRSPCGERP